MDWGRTTDLYHILLVQGKAAWEEKERERRVSVTEAATNHRIKATEAHRRWMKRNRIHDSSFGGSSSDDDDYAGGLRGQQNAAANALLYVGLGTIAIGLVISFVGTGEKGFKTLELRLIGPTLIGSGLLCCLVRVFLCVCPSRCFRRDHKQKKCHKNSLKIQISEQERPSAGHLNHHSFLGNAKCGPKESQRTDEIAMADQTKLLQKNIHSNYNKSVSILATPVATATIANMPVPLGSSGHSSHRHHQQQHNLQHQQQIPKNVVACTSLFLQHEQESSSFINYGQYLQVPSINIPNSVSNSDEEDILASAQLFEDSKRRDSNLLDFELQQLDSNSFDISSFEGSNEREEILRTGRAGSVNICRKHSDSDKRRTSLISAHRNNGATLMTSTAVIATTATYSPSTSIGLVNPDPDAHKLEEEMLLLEEEIQKSSTISNDLKNSPFASAVSSASPGKHSDVDSLLQNEIVLSPSKLQQAVRKQ